MLADAIGWALPELRVEAEQNMTSTCTIRAKSTGRTVDESTGAVVPVAGAVSYSGPCRVRPASAQGVGGSTVDVGGAESFTFDYLVSIPFAEAGVQEGYRVRIDSSPDPSLIGVEVEVQRVDRGEHITARRLACSEVT